MRTRYVRTIEMKVKKAARNAKRRKSKLIISFSFVKLIKCINTHIERLCFERFN